MTRPDARPQPHPSVSPEARLVAHVMQQAAAPMSAATRERLAQALLDWFTAGWSALDMPAAARLRALAADLFVCGGPAPVFGGAGGTPLAAGFANAAIAHLREIDDAHRAAMLHPGVVAISPVLALASAASITRARVARAIVAGYEVSLRLGEALGEHHAGRFHATATAGGVGAGAASAVALGLDAAQLHHTLGIAATQAAGLWQFVDDDAHDAKPLHPAFAVRNGMTAAFAARAGLPGARAFVTGARGLYAALGGSGSLSVLDHELEAPARLHTATIKAWPACAMLFTPLDATRALIDEYGVHAADVAAMEVVIFPHALKIAGVVWPAQASETSFSLRYVLAVLLLKGRLAIADMEEPDLADPALRALADRIIVHTDDEYQKVFPDRRPSRVTLTLHDGRTLGAYRDLRRGDPEDPFTWPSLQARMRTFSPRMTDATARALVDWCEGFLDPALDDAPCELSAALFGPGAPT